jgi:hypothetical protein
VTAASDGELVALQFLLPLHPDERDDFAFDADMLYMHCIANLVFSICCRTKQLPPMFGDGDLSALTDAIDELLDEPVPMPVTDTFDPLETAKRLIEHDQPQHAIALALIELVKTLREQAAK